MGIVLRQGIWTLPFWQIFTAENRFEQNAKPIGLLGSKLLMSQTLGWLYMYSFCTF